MINMLAVFLGGGLGALLRFLTSKFITRNLALNLPVATLVVNFTGSLILGLTLGYLLNKTGINPLWRNAIVVGFCGGLTTFSTFSFEIVDMMKNGDYLVSLLYIFISLLVCLGAVVLGLYLGKLF